MDGGGGGGCLYYTTWVNSPTQQHSSHGQGLACCGTFGIIHGTAMRTHDGPVNPWGTHHPRPMGGARTGPWCILADSSMTLPSRIQFSTRVSLRGAKGPADCSARLLHAAGPCHPSSGPVSRAAGSCKRIGCPNRGARAARDREPRLVVLQKPLLGWDLGNVAPDPAGRERQWAVSVRLDQSSIFYCRVTMHRVTEGAWRMDVPIPCC